MVEEAARIRSEKLREHQYREEYVRFPEGKGYNGMEIIMSSVCGNR